VVFNKLWEERAISFQTIFETGDDIAFSSNAGTNVTEENVYQIAAVWSAVSLISDTIGTLPVDVFFRDDGNRRPFRPKPSWVAQPDVNFNGHSTFYKSVLVSLLIDGNAFIRVFSNRRGEVVNLNVLNPNTVEVKRNGEGRFIFTVVGEDKPLTSEEIVYIPDLLKPGQIRGVSRVGAMRENLSLAKALESYAPPSSEVGQPSMV